MNCSTGEDFLLIPQTNCEYRHCRLQVFNRWGTSLHDSQSVKPIFDGEQYDQGTYYYIFEGAFKSGEEFSMTGYFSILR